jgi:hypothetical protein
MSTTAWATHDAAETALAAARILQAAAAAGGLQAAAAFRPRPPVFPSGTPQDRGAVAAASRKTGLAESSGAVQYKSYTNAAAVAMRGASETVQGTREIVQALKHAIEAAEAAQQSATDAAEAAHSWTPWGPQ